MLNNTDRFHPGCCLFYVYSYVTILEVLCTFAAVIYMFASFDGGVANVHWYKANMSRIVNPISAMTWSLGYNPCKNPQAWTVSLSVTLHPKQSGKKKAVPFELFTMRYLTV